MPRVTILGTGFVGTSLGLALKAHRPDLEIVGHDREYARAGEAKKMGAIDRADWNIPSALEGAGLVIIATPLAALERLLGQIGEFLQPGCVVTDTASLKEPVLRWADLHLRGRANYVSGNPIVGNVAGDRRPSATIFADRTYCIVPSVHASDDAVEQVTRLTVAIGAKPLFLDAAEHDGFVATVDQLPGLLASLLMSFASNGPAWRDGQRLAGPVFGAATSMALDDPADRQVALLANREALVRSIQLLQVELGEVARLVESGSVAPLQKLLDEARDHRAAWQPGVGPVMEDPATDMPRARDQLSTWFLGGLRGRKR
ncbi:MAG TPA: prephenate dehydrogenase/arogenate dehydrogenase family protein [Chloroflexota bacterium]|nr:prephenate dehydrogenase/arogenate dehydrogenase family protein [Chloroflexota bacterium]